MAHTTDTKKKKYKIKKKPSYILKTIIRSCTWIQHCALSHRVTINTDSWKTRKAIQTHLWFFFFISAFISLIFYTFIFFFMLLPRPVFYFPSSPYFFMKKECYFFLFFRRECRSTPESSLVLFAFYTLYLKTGDADKTPRSNYFR